jgi:hypothetical protein
MKILIQSTPVALWHEIIHDAEATCSISLNEELESYLVFLMMRYTSQPDIVKKIMATHFLEGVNSSPSKKLLVLQQVGDNCLIFSGLFPKMAEKRLVKISYFVNMGRTAYSAISQHQSDLYDSLSNHFVPLMDVLQSVRHSVKDFPDLLPFEAYDLWNETGSLRALSVLKQYTFHK